MDTMDSDDDEDQQLPLAAPGAQLQAIAWQNVWRQAQGSYGAPNPSQLGDPLSAHKQDLVEENANLERQNKNVEASLQALVVRVERLEDLQSSFARGPAAWPSERDEH